MEHKICEYCGTEYDASLEECPLCGKVNEAMDSAAPSSSRGKGARLAPKEDRIPRGLQIVICIVLGLAVVIGAVFAISNLGAFSKDKPDEGDPNLSLPLDGENDKDPDADKTSGDDKTGPTKPGDPEAPDGNGAVDPTMPPVDPSVPDGQDTKPEESVIACTRLTIDRTDVTFKAAGESFVLKADVFPSDCTEKVVFESQDESLCKVDENGTVTAVNGRGMTEIIVSCGEKSQSCIVRCNFAHDPSVVTSTQEPSPGSSSNATLSSEDITLFTAGETAKLTVKNAASGADVVWATSNASVATVTNGTVTAVSSGTANITAQVEGKTLTCIVRCKLAGTVPATNNNAETTGTVGLSQTDVTLFTAGEAFTLSVQGDTSAHTWSVSDASVCTVDASGKVTAVSSGTATVSTTVNGQTLSCIVRVKLG